MCLDCFGLCIPVTDGACTLISDVMVCTLHLMVWKGGRGRASRMRDPAASISHLSLCGISHPANDMMPHAVCGRHFNPVIDHMHLKRATNMLAGTKSNRTIVAV